MRPHRGQQMRDQIIPASTDGAIQDILDGPSVTVTIEKSGSVDHQVYFGDSDLDVDRWAQDLIDRELKRGHAVTCNGITRWRERCNDINPGQTGSGVFVWNEKRTRIRCSLIEVSRTENGEITRKQIKKVWIKP